jgi:hypothetical protein
MGGARVVDIMVRKVAVFNRLVRASLTVVKRLRASMGRLDNDSLQAVNPGVLFCLDCLGGPLPEEQLHRL